MPREFGSISRLCLDKRIDGAHTRDMTNTENTETASDLTYALELATINIKKATRLGLSNMAQDIRRQRKSIIAKLEAMNA
jgi:hypothetical protein